MSSASKAKRPASSSPPTSGRRTVDAEDGESVSWGTRFKRVLSRIGRREAIIAALILVLGGWALAQIDGGGSPGKPPAGTIESPAAGSRVAREFTVAGTLSDIPEGEHLWLAVQVGNLLYPKEPEVGSSNDHFSEQIVEGGNPPGGRFSLVLLKVGAGGQTTIERWLSALRAGEDPPALTTISGASILDAVANLSLED